MTTPPFDGNHELQTRPHHGETGDHLEHARHQITDADRQAAYHHQDQQRTRDANHPALPGLELFDHGRVVPEAVRPQMNDAYFMATMASMASNPQGQQILHNMFQPIDGSHTRVTFGNGQSEVVRNPQGMDFMEYAQNSGHGLWANVAERGYGQMIARQHGEDPVSFGPRGATEVQSMNEIFRTAVGNLGSRHEMRPENMTEDQLHQQLSQFAPPHSFMMVARSSAIQWAGAYPAERPRDARVVGSGEAVATSPDWPYPVDRYDSRTRTVYLNDIYGRRELQMPLRDFRREFVSVDAMTR